MNLPAPGSRVPKVLMVDDEEDYEGAFAYLMKPVDIEDLMDAVLRAGQAK